MAIKKHDFKKILLEYNKKYGMKYTLNLKISIAIIIHNTNKDTFVVEYLYDDSFTKQNRDLTSFLYYNVSDSVSISGMKGIITDKEAGKLNLKIKIWPPNKIKYAYLQTNYFSDAGNLGKSCMRVSDMQKSLNFYVKNNVSIVVVVDDNNKIHARALLWDNVKSKKLKNPFTYLDRVYARSDMLLSLFYDLAAENKWKRYPSTTVNEMDRSYYKDGIDAKNMCHLPYMDTFRYLYPKDNLIASGLSKERSGFTELIVHNNRGYYPHLDPNRVREALSGSYISKKDAIFVKRYDGWVLKKNIADINGDYYSVFDTDTVVNTKYDGWILKKYAVKEVFTDEMMDITNAIQSTKYKGYIHKSNVIGIKDEVYHKADPDITCFDNKWYHISQCFVNYDRKEYNEELAREPIFFHKDLYETWIPNKKITRKGTLIPKELAIIAYDIAYNAKLDKIEYQEVYCMDKMGLIQLNTGELIINSSKNKTFLKRFNGKYYIKESFKLQDKKQLTLFKV